MWHTAQLQHPALRAGREGWGKADRSRGGALPLARIVEPRCSAWKSYNRGAGRKGRGKGRGGPQQDGKGREEYSQGGQRGRGGDGDLSATFGKYGTEPRCSA